jgi:ElaB/YqjD/DUF883 family membrane-anchored ribosome-binding protein
MTRMDNPMNQGGQTGVGEQAKDKAKDVAGKAKEYTEEIKETAREQYDNAKQQYEHLREQAGEYYERGRDAAVEWEQELENYVQDRPIQSLLVAAGVGFLLGMIWKRS